MIDRLGPTRRPPGAATSLQQWRSLLFMHWPVPIDVLRPLVPAPLELDLYNGVAYVGVVPFAMQAVRPRWCPSWLALDFLETNVRTYVCHGDRPGVYFFSLDASSWLAVRVARTFWGLPYFHARMSLRREQHDICYESVRRRSGIGHRARCRVAQLLGPSEPGSIEFFFLERYLLFLERRERIFAGQVYHTAYPAQRAEVLELDDQLVEAAGITGVAGPPAFVHYAAGVDVEIFGLQAA